MSLISVTEIFSHTNIFVIPTFQLPYAWELE